MMRNEMGLHSFPTYKNRIKISWNCVDVFYMVDDNIIFINNDFH